MNTLDEDKINISVRIVQDISRVFAVDEFFKAKIT